MAILAYRRPVFQKAMRIITAITNAFPASVTTSFNHNYITGMIVRLNIPMGYGMQQANQLYGPIIVTGNTTFTIDIDTISMDPFVYQINVGTTDGSGSASGTISGTNNLIGLGQLFNVGALQLSVVSGNGALYTTSSASGTMNLSTGSFTLSGCPINTVIYWTPIAYPNNFQYANVTPIGEISATLLAATRNALPYPANS